MKGSHRAALFHYPFSVFILRGFSKEKPRKIFAGKASAADGRAQRLFPGRVPGFLFWFSFLSPERKENKNPIHLFFCFFSFAERKEEKKMKGSHRAALFHYPFSVFILRAFSKEKPRKIVFADKERAADGRAQRLFPGRVPGFLFWFSFRLLKEKRTKIRSIFSFASFLSQKEKKRRKGKITPPRR